MSLAYIGVGSNLGDREGIMQKALDRLRANRFLSILQVSPIYETEPVNCLPQGRFLNAVWEIETDMPVQTLFRDLLSVENFLGRKRGPKNSPRTIDLDLLAYGDLIVESQDLIIPHRRLHERLFVLKPFYDVNPNWIHPRFHRSIRDFLLALQPVLQNVEDCR